MVWAQSAEAAGEPKGGIIRRITKAIAIGVVAVTAGLGLAACTSEADTASYNLSQDAEQFLIERHIVAINDITGDVLLEVVGRCSVETANSALAGALEMTCKVADNEYKKNYITLPDNVSVVVEQLGTVDTSVYHYQWLIKPENLLPEFVVDTGQQ